ncbi:DUF421 domain-containing protein [Croceicoccus marinus]|uniref:DUF421 domain-containing protein n=2 Tax=Croceicoccus marinus TaxID=450378 RepID=A0A7G6VXL7_9SPHN|nr:DUF421 domain-containing protein [Croceicoccus marinus]
MLFGEDLGAAVLRGLVLGAFALMWVVLLVRILGLRSFSKMTNFDFVMTIAMGSLIASASQSENIPPFLQGLAAMVSLFAVQWTAARLRKSSDKVEAAISNTPLVLMRNGEYCEEALKATRVSRNDLVAKLREANVMDFSEVRAVVLETTGDISVLHGDHLNESLLKGVARGPD